MSVKNLTGRKITKVRNMTKEELENIGWDEDRKIIILELDDGAKIFPSADSEGSYGGELFGITPKGEDIMHFI